MAFLKPEQMNAARQSFRNRGWMEGLRIATDPLRSSMRRMGKTIIRDQGRNNRQDAHQQPIPAFSDIIAPLYFPKARDLSMATGLDPLFSDVNRQARGEFRLAGGSYQRVEFGPDDRFTEIEDCHALDRLYWAARYARAAAFGHPDAYTALRPSWKKWLQSTHSSVTFSSYTVAERIASLSECLFWLGHCRGVDAAVIISMKGQVWKDVRRLFSNIEYGLGVHNHLLNDARGLFRASRVLPDLPEAPKWAALAFHLWEEYFPKLVMEDGTFAEQSSHYHLLLSRTALEYFLAARLFVAPFPEGLQSRLSRMLKIANDLLRPDGSLPRFGDNSPDHTVQDLWGLMSAAYYHGLLQTPPRHGMITPLTLLYCGEAPRLPTLLAPWRNSFYPEGGFMFLRSEDRSAELVVHADPCSQGRAHGDSGRGSFELWWRGHVVVKEPGSILSSSNARSEWSRSAMAQNVTSLNGLAPGVTLEERKSLPLTYANQGGSWAVCREREIILRWNGFHRIREDIILWRTWSFDNAHNLNLEERIDGTGKVRYQSRLCLGDGCWKLYKEQSNRIAHVRWAGAAGHSVLIELNLPPEVIPTLTAGWYLPEFGAEKQATVLVLSGSVVLPTRWSAKWQFCTASNEILSELSQPCAG